MKRFFLKAIILMAPFLMVLGFVEYELRQIPNSYSTTKAAFEKELADIDVLVTGSSHALAAVRTQLLDGHAFNLANGSQSLHYDTELVLKYADAMKNLKLVIFTISYFSLEYRLDKSIERWRAGFYQQVYDLPDEDGRKPLKLTNYSFIALYTPKVAYSFVLQKLRAGKAVDPASEGTERNIGIKGDVSLEDGRIRMRLHQSMMYKNNVPGNVQALERVCSLLRAKGIAVAFMTTPVHETYSAYVRPAELQRMQDTIKQLSEKYQVEYFNYMSDPRFSTEDYLNSDHLNPQGAEKFSRIINEDIVKRFKSR